MDESGAPKSRQLQGLSNRGESMLQNFFKRVSGLAVTACPVYRQCHFAKLASITAMIGLALVPGARAASDAECVRVSRPNADCGTHNMMLVGQESVFLSHLPMFHREHRFQLIFEADFRQTGKQVTDIYVKDRAKHPDVKMYTVSPAETFILSRLWSSEPGNRRDAFQAAVFRGHLERGGRKIVGLGNAEVKVKRLVYFRELADADGRIDKLGYILFGKGKEFFMAHQISRAPDFDQILAIDVTGHAFTDGELERGVTIAFDDRENQAPKRIKAGETADGQGHVGGAHEFLALRIEARRELYFEEGELLNNPTFKPTAAEKQAGF